MTDELTTYRPGATSVIMGAAVLALALAVWMQTAALTTTDSVTSLGRMLSMGLPLLAVLGGVVTRSAVMLLAMFPLTLLPPMLLGEAGGVLAFTQPWSALQVAASLALYITVVSIWVGTSDAPAARAESAQRHAFTALARGHVHRRIFPLLLWWAVPTYTIFWDPVVVGTLEQQFGDDAVTAQLFASVMVFFAWLVVAYMMFIVPSLNLEYDYRRFVRNASAMVVVTRQQIARRLAWTFGGTVLVTLLLLAVV